jgi:integrase
VRGNGQGSIYANGARWRVAIPYRDPATGRTRHSVLTVQTEEQAELVLAGQGFVSQDGARWRASVPYIDPQSGRTRLSITRNLASRRAAEHALSTRVSDRQAGVDLSDMTVAEFLERWLPGERLRIRASTYRGHEAHIRLYIVPAIGHFAVAGLRAHHVEDMMTALVERGLSPTTARHARITLGKALRIAMRDGLAARNAAAEAKLPALDQREMLALDEDEVTRLIAACEQDDTAAADAVIVAVQTGLRQGELLGLGRRDLALDDPEPYLDVRQALARARDGGFAIGPTKTRQSRRRIPLSAPAVRALRRQRARQATAQLGVGSAWRETGLVFTNEIGEHLTGWHVTKRFQLLGRRARVRPCRFHDLRHSAASTWLNAGMDIKTVSKLLGHTSIAITGDVYAHVSPARLQEAANIMNRLFEPTARASS